MGIGLTNPMQKLEVNGNIKCTNLISTKIGINVENPVENLEVNGNIKCSDLIKTSYIYGIYRSGNYCYTNAESGNTYLNGSEQILFIGTYYPLIQYGISGGGGSNYTRIYISTSGLYMVNLRFYCGVALRFFICKNLLGTSITRDYILSSAGSNLITISGSVLYGNLNTPCLLNNGDYIRCGFLFAVGDGGTYGVGDSEISVTLISRTV